MILIISEKNDLTTNEVIDWLIEKRVTFQRVNSGDASIVGYDLQKNNFEIKLKQNNKTIHSDNIHAVWYRRGGLEFNFELLKSESLDFKRQIFNYLQGEYSILKEYVYKVIKQNNSINSDLDNTINKIEVLQKAKQVGLEIPRSIICSTRVQIEDFIRDYQLKGVITKSINNGLSYWSENVNIEEYTSLIKIENIEEYPTTFYPSLIQENISKKFEIRTFFLEDKTYSVAVFSQSNQNTKVDSRKRNMDKPHRSVPFVLPKKIESTLIQLMKEINLNSGSIDFIYTVDRRFIFLEVNPIGQFAQVSYPGNYQLEEVVAQTLLNFSNNE